MILTRAEILNTLGLAGSATEAQLGLVEMMRPWVEGPIRDYLGYNPGQERVVEILPPISTALFVDEFADDWDERPVPDVGVQVLRLTNVPVRSVYEVRENPNANGVSANFTDQNVLPTSSYSWTPTGQLIRNYGWWGPAGGSVLVDYLGGYTPAELNQTAVSAIKLAAAKFWQRQWHAFVVDQQKAKTGAAGPLIRERLPDWEAQYANDKSRVQLALPDDVRQFLDPHVVYR